MMESKVSIRNYFQDVLPLVDHHLKMMEFQKKNQAFALPSGGGNSRPRTVSELKNKPQKKFQTIPYIGYIA
jgi:hypothetical protein